MRKKLRRQRRERLAKAFVVGMAVSAAALLWLRPGRAKAAELPQDVHVEADYPLLAQLSAYWPAASESELGLEGGPVDTREKPLHSLEDFLAGKAPFVSVAADFNEFAYGEPIRIKELELKYDREIDFRVVDALHADDSRKKKGTGTRRLDIRVSSRRAGLDDSVNSWVHYRRLNPRRGAVVGEVAA